LLHLADWQDGGRNREEANEHRRWLTSIEEDIIVTFTIEMGARGFPLSHRRLKEHVDRIARARLGSTKFPDSRCWQELDGTFHVTSSQTVLKWRTHALLKTNVGTLSTLMQTHITGVNLIDHSRSTNSNERLVSAQMKLASWHVALIVNASLPHERRKDLNINNELVLEKIPRSLLPFVQMERPYHLPLSSRALHTKSVGEMTIL
jgi:hypothetical protein